MKLLILSIFTLISSLAQADSRPAFVGPYLEIQTILAKDSTEGLPAHVQALTGALKKSRQEKAAKAASLMEGAKSIVEYRDRFQKVSEILLPWMKKHKMRGLILAYCPMKKAYWLQAKGDLRNPYYGAEMLECGVEEEQK